ncbi:MAG: GNAT family N-acetyltransferase [Microbacteriaceae bacterium]|nr:MAG: GNAT family N-acetyltransferase [Microbacteriaceae bacterium]
MTSAAAVRTARPNDAEGIAHVHVQAWREAYAGVMSDKVLANLSEERRATWWRHVIENETATRCAVAEYDGNIIGFASAGPTRDDDATRDLELFTIYTLESMYGTGVGSALLEAVIGDAPATLWVAEDNPRAHAFYAKKGFEPDGATRFDGIAEVRMVR